MATLRPQNEQNGHPYFHTVTQNQNRCTGTDSKGTHSAKKKMRKFHCVAKTALQFLIL
uniref:Uncharacterized protein n=1 Tax=Anguilla anguilla TaxID=7936 RepID=A0A0E9TEF9_ANGAN